MYSTINFLKHHAKHARSWKSRASLARQGWVRNKGLLIKKSSPNSVGHVFVEVAQKHSFVLLNPSVNELVCHTFSFRPETFECAMANLIASINYLPVLRNRSTTIEKIVHTIWFRVAPFSPRLDCQADDMSFQIKCRHYYILGYLFISFIPFP